MKTPSKTLTPREKTLAMRSIFFSQKNQHNFVKNPADYLSKNFDKIDGFDARWSSLITNNPLLFEDVDYVRIKHYINNEITDEEKEAYKRGELREIYATFDNMLMCNLKYYDRIINFCTMVFLHYIRIDGEIFNEHLDKVPYELEMTPTKIWCCALSSIKSSEWELNYAWSKNNQKLAEKPIEGSNKSAIEVSWTKLYRNTTFSKFTEYCSVRCNTNGFRATILADITSNRKLSQVCGKFTKTSVAISEQQLDSIYEYIKEIDGINSRLYTSITSCLHMMFEGDTSQYSVYIYSNEFYIHTSKFSIKVSKDERGKITKEYLANSFECFAAEEYLMPSIKMQIEWAKYQLPIHYEYDKAILSSLLQSMLEQNYREILCFKRMNDFGIVSKVTFTGIFNNVRINEDLMLDNRSIKFNTKVLSKKNAAKYLIDKGYYICGISSDVHKLLEINKETIINHYNNYCVPVIQHMFEVITTHEMMKNDIIDVVCKGILNPEKINNKNIKYTNLVEIDERQLLSVALAKQNKRKLSGKKGYWKVIDS